MQKKIICYTYSASDLKQILSTMKRKQFNNLKIAGGILIGYLHNVTIAFSVLISILSLLIKYLFSRLFT